MNLLQKQLQEKNNFLLKAYEVASDYAPSNPLSVNIKPRDLGKTLGFDESTTQRIMYELVDEGYATSSLGMHSLFVTSSGLNYLRNIEVDFTESETVNNISKESANVPTEEKDLNSDKGLDMKKEVFVTYRWENDEHNNRVIAFVNYLRENGYNATMDRFESQKETSKDFIKMMHQAMTDYEKVIIVLSEGYKQRADSFEGGVGSEYGLIIKDIDSSRNKYILVCFEEINDAITPLNFKGRELIYLENNGDYNRLHAKLQDEKIYEFAPVGIEKPNVIKESIASLEIPSTDGNIEILGFDCKAESIGRYLGEIRSAEFKISLNLKNIGKTPIREYTAEIIIPSSLYTFDLKTRIQGDKKAIIQDINPIIFPTQTVSLAEIPIKITFSNARQFFLSKINVKIYTSNNVFQRTIDCADILFEPIHGEKQKLEINDFLLNEFGAL